MGAFRREKRYRILRAPLFRKGGDFTASDTLIEIEDETFFNDIREKCDEAGSVLDTAAGVTVKVTFSDGTVITHDATIAA